MNVLVPLQCELLSVNPSACRAARVCRFQACDTANLVAVVTESAVFSISADVYQILHNWSIVTPADEFVYPMYILHTFFVPVYICTTVSCPGPKRNVPHLTCTPPEYIVPVTHAWGECLGVPHLTGDHLSSLRSSVDQRTRYIPECPSTRRVRYSHTVAQDLHARAEWPECQLCMENHARVFPECGHVLCTECYYRTTGPCFQCPVCRYETAPESMRILARDNESFKDGSLDHAVPASSAAAALCAVLQRYGTARVLVWSNCAKAVIHHQVCSLCPELAQGVSYVLDIGHASNLTRHGTGPVVVDAASVSDHASIHSRVHVGRAIACATQPNEAPLFVLLHTESDPRATVQLARRPSSG